MCIRDSDGGDAARQRADALKALHGRRKVARRCVVLGGVVAAAMVSGIVHQVFFADAGNNGGDTPIPDFCASHDEGTYLADAAGHLVTGGSAHMAINGTTPYSLQILRLKSAMQWAKNSLHWQQVV